MSVLVFVEAQEGKLKKSAAEVIGAAKTLAEGLGVSLDACLIGDAVSSLAADAGSLGAARVFLAEDAALGDFDVSAYRKAVMAVVAAAEPKVFCLAASVVGKDLGAAVAASWDAPLLADVIDLEAADGGVCVQKPVFAGKATAHLRSGAERVVVSLRPNVFEPAAPGGAEAAVEAVDAGVSAADARTKVTELKAKESEKLDLTEADIIVSGGRGLKDPENFHLVESLAEVLGGVVGASRAVVDAGWRPHEEQVGQTGKTVSPKLYVAVAISGAIQHLAGMRTSKCIVAINTDPDAPIFKVADYGVQGDAFEVVPALVEALRAELG